MRNLPRFGAIIVTQKVISRKHGTNWANPILLDQLSPSALRLPRADGVLTGQRIFVDFAIPHDNAKISVGFFEGPDLFQGIAIGESKQCD